MISFFAKAKRADIFLSFPALLVVTAAACAPPDGAPAPDGSDGSDGGTEGADGGKAQSGCFSHTLNRQMADNACVQSGDDDNWYQCAKEKWVDRWSDEANCCSSIWPLHGKPTTDAAAACGTGGASKRSGADYSWSRPSPASLKAQGFTFVARYLSHDDSGKNLTKGEADELRAAGIDIVCNWEGGSDAALEGHAQGVSDAKAANEQALAVGMPADRPIYFSVDFDVQSDQDAAVTAYFEGVASVLGVERTGAYGGLHVIKMLFDGGKIKWGWQTYAWSGGAWDARAQVRQVENGIDNGELDKDESVASDFGEWR